jgi:uncharacterized protein YndB with AHSA1/START domain
VSLLKGLFYAAIALIGLALAVGLFLPEAAHVERTVTTSASPDSVYRIVNGFRRFNEWSPWFDLDPQARYVYTGPETGVGARMAWTSDKRDVGSGSQEILAVDPGRMVKTRLDFGSEGLATSTLTIEPEGPGSRLTWAFDTSFSGNFLGRYFGLMFDKFIGRDYEKGLARLKALAEAEPAAPPSAIQPPGPGTAPAGP